MTEMTEEEMEEARKLAEDKMRTIDYVVDTLNIRDGEKGWGGNSGWGLNSKGVITAHYNIYESGYINDNSIDYYTLYVHEQKHRDNMENGIYEYPMSLEQAYKINMHDEISATMAELLQLREEYLQTGDISIFDKAPKLSFYKEAIEKGEIKPGSEYKEDFDKEMSFIVNGTRDMWVNNSSSRYVEQNSYFATDSYDDSGKYAQYYDENYERAKKIAYNIGGVDFTKYMDKDVEIPEQGLARMREDLAAYSGRIEAYDPDGPHTYEIFDKNAEDGIRTFTADNAEEYYTQVLNNNPEANAFMRGLPQYEGNMSMEQYHKYLQHYLTVQEFQKEAKFGDLQKLAQEKGCSIEEVYQEKYNEAFNKVQEEYGDLIDVATDKAAIDWDKRKELNGGWWNPIPSEEHGQGWYDSAIKKLYDSPGMSTVERCDEELMRPLPKYAQSVNDKANGEEPGWWDKLCNKVKSWGVETEVRDLSTEENIEVGFWKGLKNKVSNWFKASPQQEPVKNEPIHPVNKGTPEYPKWSKDKRVSEVQHRQIPDMRKPIIKQPTQSKTDHQQGNTSVKTATTVKMKSDIKKAQLASGRPKNKSTSYQSKTILKSTMKKDASKAQKMLQNIGKQKTTTKKVAKIGYKPPSQKQVFKDLYDKVFGR